MIFPHFLNEAHDVALGDSNGTGRFLSKLCPCLWLEILGELMEFVAVKVKQPIPGNEVQTAKTVQANDLRTGDRRMQTAR